MRCERSFFAPEEQDVYSPQAPHPFFAPTGAKCKSDEQAHGAPLERKIVKISSYKHCAPLEHYQIERTTWLISPKSQDAQDDLNKRLRSLKIDRGPAPSPATSNRSPKLLFLGVAVVLALAALGYVFLFSSAKTISVAPVRTETGAESLGESVLSASGYVVAHHKIAVGAKVMGRVSWIGVEKGDQVQEGQVLVRLEESEFRAQVNQAKANLAAAQARLDQLRTGSRPEEKLKDRAAVLQAEANLKNAEAEYQRN